MRRRAMGSVTRGTSANATLRQASGASTFSTRFVA